MIDWLNALIGFGLGLLTSLVFWIPDRVHARRLRQRDVWEAWKVAVNELELLIWNPETRAADLHNARTRHPIDHWRTVLDDRTGFVLLERLEAAYGAVEHFGKPFTQEPFSVGKERFIVARDEWQAARVAFANDSRHAQSEGYNELIRREERQQRRQRLLRHPIKTIRCWRNNDRRAGPRTKNQLTPQ